MRWSRGESLLRLTPFRIFAAVLLVGVVVWTPITGKLLTLRWGDGQEMHLPSRVFSGQIYRTGHLPLWNPYKASGMPHAALVQPGVFYPLNLVYGIFPPALAYNLSVVLHFLLLVFFTKKYMGTLRLPAAAQALGTAAFALTGFMTINIAGAIPVFNAAIWIPAVFYCAEKWIAEGRWKYAAWGGICLAMPLLAGWAQFLVLISVYLSLYVLFALSAVPDRRRLIAGFLFMFAIAACLVLPQVVLTLEFKRYTSLQALSWSFFCYTSYPPQLLLLLLFPCFFGPGLPGFYKPGFWWGPPDAAIMTIYAGILPLMLAVAALSRSRSSRIVRFSATAVVLAWAMAFGGYTPIGHILFHIPFLNFFHDHWVNVAFFNFAVAVLAAFGSASLGFSSFSPKARKVWSIGIPVGIIGIAALVLIESRRLVFSINQQISPLGSDWFRYFHQTVKFNNRVVTVPVALILCFACFFWLWTRRPASKAWACWAAILVGCDLLFFVWTYVPWTTVARDLSASPHPAPASQKLLDAMWRNSGGKPFRVIASQAIEPMFRVNANSLAGYSDVLGYEPFLLYPYSDLINLNTGGSTGLFNAMLVNNRILSMLDDRYVIVQEDAMHDIHSFIDTAGTPSGKVATLGANLLELENWRGLSRSEQVGKVSSFSSDGDHLVGITQPNLTLEPNTIYQFSFDSRADAGKVAELVGVVKQGDHVELCHMLPQSLADTYRRNTCLFMTPSAPASDQKAEVTLITTSAARAYVTNISLQAAGSLPVAGGYREISRSGGLVLLENQNTMPRAFFVRSIRPVASYIDARSQLWQVTPSLDLRNVALVETSGNPIPAEVSPGHVDDLQYKPNQAWVRTTCAADCFLVLGDAYFPGWRASVDGKRTEIFRTDGVLRGVLLPPGAHEVKFEYVPPNLLWPFGVMMFGLFVAAGVIWRERAA